jgi:hypothetical protein
MTIGKLEKIQFIEVDGHFFSENNVNSRLEVNKNIVKKDFEDKQKI